MQLSLVQLLQKYNLLYMHKAVKIYNISLIMNQKYVLQLLCLQWTICTFDGI